MTKEKLKDLSVINAYREFEKISASLLDKKLDNLPLEEDLIWDRDAEFGKWILSNIRNQCDIKISDLDLSEERIYFVKIGGAIITTDIEKIKNGNTYRATKNATLEIENNSKNIITVLIDSEIIAVTVKEAKILELVEIGCKCY